MYTVIDCLFSSSYFHLYQTSSTIDYFFSRFLSLHRRRRRRFRFFSLSLSLIRPIVSSVDKRFFSLVT